MKKYLLGFIAMLMTLPAMAETSLTTGFKTYHFHNNSTLNDNNYGLGLEHNGWIAGYYDNSYRKNSFYVGHEWKTNNPHWNLGLEVAAVSGYDNKTFSKLEGGTSHPICVSIAPEIMFTEGRFTLAAVVAPPISGETNGMLSFQARWKVGK